MSRLGIRSTLQAMDGKFQIDIETQGGFHPTTNYLLTGFDLAAFALVKSFSVPIVWHMPLTVSL